MQPLKINIKCIGQTYGGDLLFETGWRKECMSGSIIKISLDELKLAGLVDEKEDGWDIEGRWFEIEVKKGD